MTRNIFDYEWRKHPEYPHIEVSEYGEIFSSKLGRKLNLTPTQGGYLKCSICQDKEHILIYSHRCVARCWHGPAPSALHRVVGHLDNNNQNNHYSNLRWQTNSENMLQKRIDGTIGDRCGQKGYKRFSEETIRHIRESEDTQYNLAAHYDCCAATINNIRLRRTYRHVS